MTSAVAISADKIVAVGPSEEIVQKYSAPQRIDVRGQIVLPGLINTHEHITYAQNLPYVNMTGERWAHRHEWRKGLNGTTKIPSAGGASGDALPPGGIAGGSARLPHPVRRHRRG